MAKRKKKSASSGPRPTLVDAAALLVQLEATDPDGARALGEVLESVIQDLPPDGLAAALTAEGAHELSRLADGTTRDGEAALAQVSRLLELALNEADAPEAAAATSPAAGATPSAGTPAANADADEAPVEARDAADGRDAELVEGFVAEAQDYLESAEAALLLLEDEPDNAEACNTVFRAFHTIKGTSAFLGLDPISELAHGAESLLSRVRAGELRFGADYADLSLGALDAIKSQVARVADGGLVAWEPDHEAVRDALLRASTGSAGENGGSKGKMRGSRGRREDAAGPPTGRPARSPDRRGAAGAAGAAGAPATGGPTGGSKRAAKLAGAGDAWMRVRTDRLDRLVDLVGELVIAQSMVAQDPDVVDATAAPIARKVAHAGKIVRELQDLSMSMRMVPLRPTFRKVARQIRDLAHRTGKTIVFEADGEETEIDRNMVELIGDPLVHMVRNAVDHGIEAPDERERSGKPVTGRIQLSAHHAGGNVVVELSDDGRGLDRERILARAQERGLIESGKGLTDGEVYDLVFTPGFSTAEQVTELSGRGVGLDVVRRNVEALRGRVEISSHPGAGTRFIIRLPLTLAITDAMLVRVGEERFIIPTVNIHMSFRPRPEQLSTVAARGEMVLLRDELMPLIRLHRLFDVDQAEADPARGLVVVVGVADRRCALLVDDLLGQQQVVAKPVGSGLKSIPGISGSAILGDGRVGLIVDVAQAVVLARQTSMQAA